MADNVHYPGGEISGNSIFVGNNVGVCVAACQARATCVIGYHAGGLCYMKNQPIKANLELWRTGVYSGYKYCVAGELRGD